MYFSHGLGDSGSVASLISSLAPGYGVPSSLALAVAQRESGLNQGAVGSSGEIGVFQLMPGTARQLGVNPSDLSQNVSGGLRYLSDLYKQFGDWGLALQAYNGGPSHVSSGTVSGPAKSYARAVLAAAGLDSGAGLDFGSLPDLPAFPDLSTFSDGSTGLSATAWAAVALAAVGLVAWAAS